MILEVDVLDRDARRTGSEAAKGKQAAESMEEADKTHEVGLMKKMMRCTRRVAAA